MQFMSTQQELAELSQEHSRLSSEKADIQSKLSAIKNLIRSSGMMPREKYKQCCDSQTELLRKMASVERRLSEIKNRKTQVNLVAFAPKTEQEKAEKRNWDSPTVITELCSLRQEYQEFSADGSRISSKRQMASEFVIKLNGIIKRALNKGSA